MREQGNVHIGFRILFFVLGMLYLFILPPFSAPDEAGHFATAYHYANVLCGVADPVVESTVGDVYRRIAMREQDAALYGHLAACTGKGNYSVLASALKEMPLSSVENVLTTRRLCRTMPYIFPLYIPAMAAILSCRFMGLGSVIMLYLARFLTFLTAWYLVCRALNRISADRRIFQVIVLFPMVLHLFSSCSADAVANAAAVYGSALVLCYRHAPVRMGRIDGITLMAALTVVTLSKPFYVFYFVVGLLLPQEVFDRKRDYYIFCLIPLFCWAWRYLPIVFSCFLEGDVSTYAGLSQGYSVGYILGHPAETAWLMVRSIMKELPYIGAQSVGLYLGPLTLRIPLAALAIFMALLLWAVFCDGDGQQILSRRLRITVVLLFVITYICFYGMDLLWWTPFGADLIKGVQGRYLLPLLGVFCAALKPEKTIDWGRLRIRDSVMFTIAALAHIAVLVSVYGQLN